MRGFGFRDHGDLDRLEYVDVPEPSPGPGEIKLRLRAAGFNRLDRFVLAGIPGVPVERPHVLGSDGAGVVAELGEGVSGPSPGSRVLLNPGLWDGSCDACRSHHESLCRSFRIVGEHTQGAAAPFLVVPSRNVHPIPERLGFEEAASAPLVFQTVWRALVTVGGVQPGETVAIVGAGGGTTTAAVQIARLRGARTVVVTRSAEKAERARGLGADDALVLSDDRPLDRLLWEWSAKRGVDVIFDSVGAPTLPRSVRALARGGRVVVIGATAGPIVELDVRTLFWRQGSIRGSTMADASEFDAVLAELARGTLRPVVDRAFDFEEAQDAFRRLESPDLFGKVVLRLPAG
ncbi:MAG TPA: zinc-binding dehydrogenase [Thermoplasmata archaeon]